MAGCHDCLELVAEDLRDNHHYTGHCLHRRKQISAQGGVGLVQGGPEALPPLRQSWVVVELELAHGIQKCTYSPRQVPHYNNYPLSIERLYV